MPGIVCNHTEYLLSEIIRFYLFYKTKDMGVNLYDSNENFNDDIKKVIKEVKRIMSKVMDELLDQYEEEYIYTKEIYDKKFMINENQNQQQ